MIDFNNANPQDELIPAGTIAKVTLKLKGGGNYGEHNLQHQSDNTGSIGLNVFFTIDEGKYKGRKFYQLIGIKGAKKNAEGADVWGDMGGSLIRSILESAYNIHPNDKSERSIKARSLESYNDLEGLQFVVKIGVEIDKTGQYSDKNKIVAAITPADKNYTTLMSATPRTQATNNANNGNDFVNDDIPF